MNRRDFFKLVFVTAVAPTLLLPKEASATTVREGHYKAEVQQDPSNPDIDVVLLTNENIGLTHRITLNRRNNTGLLETVVPAVPGSSGPLPAVIPFKFKPEIEVNRSRIRIDYPRGFRWKDHAPPLGSNPADFFNATSGEEAYLGAVAAAAKQTIFIGYSLANKARREGPPVGFRGPEQGVIDHTGALLGSSDHTFWKSKIKLSPKEGITITTAFFPPPETGSRSFYEITCSLELEKDKKLVAVYDFSKEMNAQLKNAFSKDVKGYTNLDKNDKEIFFKGVVGAMVHDLLEQNQDGGKSLDLFLKTGKLVFGDEDIIIRTGNLFAGMDRRSFGTFLGRDFHRVCAMVSSPAPSSPAARGTTSSSPYQNRPGF